MIDLADRSERIQHAILFMKSAHKGQTRRDGKTPYWHHPMRVAEVVSQPRLIGEAMETEEDVIIAALLHDVLEDTDVTYDSLYRNFGATVAGIVDLLSKPGPDEMYFRHKRYVARLAQSSDFVQTVKWADVMDNLKDLDGTDKDFKKFMADRAEAYATEARDGLFQETILQEVRRIREEIEDGGE